MDVTDVLVAAVIATAVTVLVGDWLEDRR